MSTGSGYGRSCSRRNLRPCLLTSSGGPRSPDDIGDDADDGLPASAEPGIAWGPAGLGGGGGQKGQLTCAGIEEGAGKAEAEAARARVVVLLALLLGLGLLLEPAAAVVVVAVAVGEPAAARETLVRSLLASATVPSVDDSGAPGPGKRSGRPDCDSGEAGDDCDAPSLSGDLVSG